LSSARLFRIGGKMKLPIVQPTYVTNNVQQLPNIVENQASSLQVVFDKASVDIKAYETQLTADLNGNDGSKKIGHSSLNVTSNNVSDALEELKADLVGISQGSVADGAVTDVKLSNDPTAIKARVAGIESSIGGLMPVIGTSTIPTTGWVANVGDNTLKLDLAITGVLATSWVDITIDKEFQDTALDAEINPTIVEYNGGVTLYANTAPTVAIPIRYKVVK